MSTTIEDLLSTSRRNATNEERMVLALEAISDQLGSLLAFIAPEELGISDGEGEGGEWEDGNVLADGAWEGEGADLDPSVAALGIKRSVIDQFTVGEYHYSKLSDAIAEAKRSSALADC